MVLFDFFQISQCPTAVGMLIRANAFWAEFYHHPSTCVQGELNSIFLECEVKKLGQLIWLIFVCLICFRTDKLIFFSSPNFYGACLIEIRCCCFKIENIRLFSRNFERIEMYNYFGGAVQTQVHKKLKTTLTQNLNVLITIYYNVGHILRCDSVGVDLVCAH